MLLEGQQATRDPSVPRWTLVYADLFAVKGIASFGTPFDPKSVKAAGELVSDCLREFYQKWLLFNHHIK